MTNNWGVTQQDSCSVVWGDDENSSLATALLSSVVAAALIGFIFIVIASMYSCCSVKLEKTCTCMSMPTQRKVFGALSIVVGIFVVIIPFLGSMSGCTQVINGHCSDCAAQGHECTQDDKDVLSGLCNAVGFIFAYTVAFGFIACILGPIVSVLGCAAICGCCETRTPPAVAGQPAVVVGQPAAVVAVAKPVKEGENNTIQPV